MIRTTYKDIQVVTTQHNKELCNILSKNISCSSFIKKYFTDSKGDISEKKISALITDRLDSQDKQVKKFHQYTFIRAWLKSYPDYQAQREYKKDGRKGKKEYRILHFEYTIQLSNGFKQLVDFLNREKKRFMGSNTDKTLKDIYQKAFDLLEKVYIDFKNEFNEFSKIFDYDKLISSSYRHWIVSEFDSCVCPYCNRQYITSYYEKGKIKSSADLDHFYPKSIFPQWSLSLYNFVPACQICNSRMKGAKASRIIYPHDEGFYDAAYFEIIHENLMGQIGQSSVKLGIHINDGINKIKIENSIDQFKLEDIYQIHAEYSREMMFKKNLLTQSIIDEANKIFHRGSGIIDEGFVRRALTGNYVDEKDFGKRPLAKLTSDIMKYLK